MLRYHKHEERWGEFVDTKINAPEILSKQLSKVKRGLIWISSVTDPYKAVEEQYNLTRQILQRLLSYQFPITVLTKSRLVLRDIDIFKQFKECDVGMTIITMDEIARKRFEPNASTILDRLNALKTLHEAGIKTYAFIGPFLPIISEETTDELINQLKEVGIDRVLVDKFNIKAGNSQMIRETLNQYYPKLVEEFEYITKSHSTYYSKVKKRVPNILDEKGLEYFFCY